MKLTQETITTAMSQFNGIPIPEEDPLVARLCDIFGPHTFFVSNDGLHIVEFMGPGQARQRVATVFKVAWWEDASHTKLMAHDPIPTDIVVQLHPDEAGLH